MIKGMAQHVGGVALHKFWVARNLTLFVVDDVMDACDPTADRPLRPGLYADLALRGLVHDWSKYHPDEAMAFAKTSGALKVTPYGTEEYKALLRQIKPAIERHYRRHPHHPEHHRDGIHSMSEADLIEMVADWGAAVRRGPDGDLDRSIVENAERFGYDREREIELRGLARRMRLL